MLSGQHDHSRWSVVLMLLTVLATFTSVGETKASETKIFLDGNYAELTNDERRLLDILAYYFSLKYYGVLWDPDGALEQDVPFNQSVFRLAAVDIDDDGVNEILAMPMTGSFCGTAGNCPVGVYFRHELGWRYSGDIASDWSGSFPHVIKEDETLNGWHIMSNEETRSCWERSSLEDRMKRIEESSLPDDWFDDPFGYQLNDPDGQYRTYLKDGQSCSD